MRRHSRLRSTNSAPLRSPRPSRRCRRQAELGMDPSAVALRSPIPPASDSRLPSAHVCSAQLKERQPQRPEWPSAPSSFSRLRKRAHNPASQVCQCDCRGLGQTLDAAGVAPDAQQALREPDDWVDARSAAREYDAPIANREFRHSFDSHADAIRLSAEKIEYLDEAVRPIQRIIHSERDARLHERARAGALRVRPYVDDIADENDVGLCDQLLKCEGNKGCGACGRDDQCNGGNNTCAREARRVRSGHGLWSDRLSAPRRLISRVAKIYAADSCEVRYQATVFSRPSSKVTLGS